MSSMFLIIHNASVTFSWRTIHCIYLPVNYGTSLYYVCTYNYICMRGCSEQGYSHSYATPYSKWLLTVLLARYSPVNYVVSCTIHVFLLVGEQPYLHIICMYVCMYTRTCRLPTQRRVECYSEQSSGKGGNGPLPHLTFLVNTQSKFIHIYMSTHMHTHTHLFFPTVS